MSRCFPYPPPGYTLSRASNEALIESIKLQKEREKANAERKKEKRREKDEKRKLKKEKAKSNTLGYDAYGCKSWGDSKASNLQKERKDDTEQLERSSITEEHELTQNPSYLSDSTQNSNKRKRHPSVANGTCVQGASISNGTSVQGASASNGTRVQGNILRIRLPSQKHMKRDISGGKQQLCSTSVRRDTSNTIGSRAEPDKTCSTLVATASISQALPPVGSDNELRPPYSQQTLVSPQEDMHGSHPCSKRFKKMQRVVQKYTDLIENWIPPSQQLQCSDGDDQEWLSGRKHEQRLKHPDKNNGVNKQMSCSTSASLWPSAQYLPGADVYALPYTIPF